MKIFNLLFLGAFLNLCHVDAQASPERLACADKSLTEIKSLRALPDEIHVWLDRQFGSKVKIADRGEKLDDIDEKGLGPRRFSAAGINEQCALVVLQLGGHPYHFDIIIFEHTEAGWHATRQGYLPEPPATPAALAADAETVLCSVDEDTLFSCSSGRKRHIAVCGSKNLTASSGYIQYRAAKNGILKLLFPDKNMRPGTVFAYKQRPWGKGEEDSLRFHIGDYAYTAYSNVGRFSEEHGVLVQSNGKTLERLKCQGDSDGGLGMTDIANKIRGAGVLEPSEEYDVFDQ